MESKKKFFFKSSFNKFKRKKKIFSSENQNFLYFCFRGSKKSSLRKFRFRKNYFRRYKLFRPLKQRFRWKKKSYYKLFKNKVDSALILKRKYLKKITIKVTQNNVFCTFIDLKNHKTLHIASSGLYKIKMSKKTLKRYYRPTLNLFLYNLKSYCNNFNNTIFSIVAPLKYRRYIGKIIKTNLVASKKKLRDQLKLNIKKKQKIGKRFKTSFPTKTINFKKYDNNVPRFYKKFLYKTKRNRYNVLINFINKKCFNGCRVKKQIRKKRRFFRIFK